MKKRVEKLIIIGSGPAGLTAAIYAARGGLSPVVISGRTPGGQPTLTTDVDDYPGFPEGAQGPALMVKFRAQAEKFGTQFINEDAIKINLKKRPFIVETESQTLSSESIIIATGASAKWLGLPSEKKFIGKGVSCCAVCDGPFFKNKKVAVIGGGDAAMREAQHLAKFAESVTVIHRRDTLKAQESLQKVVKSKENVHFLWNTVVEEILGAEKVSAIKVKNLESAETRQLKVEGVFMAIGHQPNTEFLQGQLKLDEKGHITVKNQTQTSVTGIFAAGDVVDFHYRQIITSASSGCQAAMDAEEYLVHNEKKIKGSSI